MQAGCHAIKIGKAGRHTRNIILIVAVIQLVDTLDHLRQQGLDFLKALCAACALFRNRENLGFGFIQHLFDFLALRAERLAGNLVGYRDQFAQHTAVTHDLRIAADIGGGWRVLRECIQIRQAAYLIGLAGPGQ